MPSSMALTSRNDHLVGGAGCIELDVAARSGIDVSPMDEPSHLPLDPRAPRAQLFAALAAERERSATLAAKLATLEARVELLEKERAARKTAYDLLRAELELLKRRMFVANAERIDIEQLELEFAAKLEGLTRVTSTLDAERADSEQSDAQPQASPAPA